MSIRFNTGFTQMTSNLSGCTAREIDVDTWVVSWLAGEWTRSQANTAMNIAEIVAHRPPMHHPYWRHVENFLAELGVDPAVLDDLIDVESDDDHVENEAEDAS